MAEASNADLIYRLGPEYQKTGRLSALDGLRGVAISAVVLAHHGLLNSGWAGVDLFFVLSGFLITSVLRKSRDNTLYWQEFYIKRATRILPPLLAFLVPILLFGYLSGWWTLACLLSFGDVVAIMHHPISPVTRPLWSLAVEEHFYLVWPFAVRHLSRKRLIYLLLAMTVCEPLIRVLAVLFYHPPTWEMVYHLTPFRLDGLCLGALLATLMESSEAAHVIKQFSGWATAIFVVLFLSLRIGIGFGFTKDGNAISFNALAYFLIALIAFCIVANVLTNAASKRSSALSWGPLVFLGRISYGLYLYHLLVLDYVLRAARINLRYAFFISAPAAVLISWVSFHFIEEPLIVWGKRKAASLHKPYFAPVATTAP